MVYNWLKNNLFKFLSQRCSICLAPTENKYLLCSNCETDLAKNTEHCIICSLPLPISQAVEKTLICGKCQLTPPHYTTSLIPHIYASPLKQLISQLKFQNNLSIALVLAENFICSLKNRKHPLPESLVPVPLHPQRLRERGFNQALELARIVADKLQIPLDYSLCQRNKATPFQSGLSAKQRRINLKNAFEITKADAYRHVAIFDDVVTTGTTVNELAKQLKKSGVEIIEVWAIARTPHKEDQIPAKSMREE